MVILKIILFNILLEKVSGARGYRVKTSGKAWLRMPNQEVDKNIHFNAFGRTTEAKLWLFVGILFISPSYDNLKISQLS